MITRWIALQFSFSNQNVIPSGIRNLERETGDGREERKNHCTGTQVVEPILNCDLANFPANLEAAGYELVGAHCQERIDAKGRIGKYWMVRFVFVRREFVIPSDEFRKVRGIVRLGLMEMCRVAMWRVRIFSNPFFQNGEEVSGQRAISINMEARRPLYCPDGQPVTVWQKDEYGDRVGDAPLPIQPDFHLRLQDGKISFETDK